MPNTDGPKSSKRKIVSLCTARLDQSVGETKVQRRDSIGESSASNYVGNAYGSSDSS